MKSLNYSLQEFVKITNQNREPKGMRETESNKLKIEIIDTGNRSLRVFSSIRFDLPEDFISKIISRETKTINILIYKVSYLIYFYQKDFLLKKSIQKQTNFYTIINSIQLDNAANQYMIH